MVEPVLAVEDLSIEFRTRSGWLRVVDHVSFDLHHATVMGLVGESGCGKTVTSLSLLGLTQAQGARVTGSIKLDGLELTSLTEPELRRLRGRRISMIFQQPARSMNPAYRVGDQIAETIRAHRKVSRSESWKMAVELLDQVAIPDAARRARDFPHAFSGGMLQRAMIATALSCNPSVLIADEPTTALDVTVQAQILALLNELRVERGLAIVIVTHDLSVVAETCDEVTVMYAGEIVESAGVDDLFRRPSHPYTAGLLASVPRPGHRGPLPAISGLVPPPWDFPRGCRFHPRCVHAVGGVCDVGHPDLRPVATSLTRCVRADELLGKSLVT